jgi:AraC-like DNA-binding protein
MSWAGKSGIIGKIRSLLKRIKQAPSVSDQAAVAAAVQQWQKSRDYLLHDSHPSRCAQSMGITPSQLHQYCLRELGMDFRTWRTSLRIEEAKKMLLAEPKAHISLIARRVGINDRSNFSRLFKEHTGYLPSDWRKLQH